jgi:hypothetical protein
MSVDDRLERLEQRVAVMETLVRNLVGQADRGAAGQTVPPAPVIPVADPVSASPSPSPDFPPVSPPPPPAPALGTASPPPRRPAAPPSRGLPEFTEQWIGQRALLAIGVFALLMALGYLLKLSFERGWIPPIARCIGGVLAGAAVGAVGWRLQPKYRTYGAALIGCGAGMVYLSVWAACRLYEVIPSTTGIVGLALVSVALAMIALAINVEALGTTAALGAFMAPVLLGSDRANSNLLLLYLASMAAGLGLVAARQRWRLTAFVVAASYFGVGTAGAAERAVPWAVLLFGVVGGRPGSISASAVVVETRLLLSRRLVFLGAGERAAGPSLAHRGGGAHSLGAVWCSAAGAGVPRSLARRRRTGVVDRGGDLASSRRAPACLGGLRPSPDRFDGTPGLLRLIALPYAGGVSPARPAFAGRRGGGCDRE